MLHDGRSVRVAVIGGSRIPFCRSHSVYRKCTNQDLMTAALQGLVAKLDLRGQTMGDVALGAGGPPGELVDLAADAVGDRVPVVAIPSGVKVYSSVFAYSPRAAAELVGALKAGGLPIAEFTFRTDVAADAIRVAREAHPEALVGAVREQHLDIVAHLARKHALPEADPVALQLYWTLYVGVLTHWVDDESPRREDTWAVLDQSLQMFVHWLEARPTR